MTEYELKTLLYWSDQLMSHRWRGLLVVVADADRRLMRGEALWKACHWQAPLWVSRTPPDWLSPRQCLAPAKARTRLGHEHQLIIMDAAGDGLDPDALGALGGTVLAGGLLVLLTAPDSGSRPDPDYRRIADYPFDWQRLSARYLARLARCLKADTGVAHWCPAGRLTIPAMAPELEPPDEAATRLEAPFLSEDQAHAVKALVGLKRRRPLVITADRGRGKSAALGIACARLLEGGVARVDITAPRPTAVAALFERLAALLPGAHWPSPHHLTLADGREVVFQAPDALAEHLAQADFSPDGRYLLVDEAAAIPPSLLARWLSAFPRIAFATTVHGYEGSGRGFAVRFRAHLDRHAPLWREITLTTPIRWRSGDPLEATLNKALLLKAALVSPLAPTHQHQGCQRLDREQLAADENALQAVVGLLVQSHYRTAPADLRQLLDGPATQIRVLGASAAPLGVSLSREEGGFSETLIRQVTAGERRPQGHLMAQSLAAHVGSGQALKVRWRRISRIAVHPEWRCQGLGKALLDAEEKTAAAAGLDLLGATFGAHPALLRFWQAAGYRPVRVGISRDTATGEHALMVARPLTQRGQRVIEELDRLLAASLPAALGFELCALPAEIGGQLLGHLPEPSLPPLGKQRLGEVAHAQRDPRLTRDALQCLARQAAVKRRLEARGPNGKALDPALDDALATLSGWAFQGRAAAATHKGEVAVLRRVTARLLEAVAPSSSDTARVG